jgi:large subunit ribosomal protein L21
MYAVVRTGGKQIRLQPGDSVRVEKLEGEIGDAVEFAEVLLIGSEVGSEVGSDVGSDALQVGRPAVAGAKVVATITDQGRGPKITVFKKKRRKNYHWKVGHRQDYTEIRVDRIES